MPGNLYCDQTTPWQGVYFFTNTVYWEIDTLYMCHSNLIVLLQHISPWTQSWIQAFIVTYENLTFKSVKQNCCFRNQRWDAAKSCQALKKFASNQPIRMQYFGQNVSNSNLNWFKVQPFSDWYIYKPVDMPHKWIGSTPK